MPSSYPFPSIAALALSLYASDKRVEKLPTVVEYDPRDTVLIVSQTTCAECQAEWAMLSEGKVTP